MTFSDLSQLAMGVAPESTDDKQRGQTGCTAARLPVVDPCHGEAKRVNAGSPSDIRPTILGGPARRPVE